MRYFILILVSFLIFGKLCAQDYLVSPGSNPKLYSKAKWSTENSKVLVQEDSFVYRYDTLRLPFIDDFSTDHFPKKVSNTSDPRVTDTLVYQIIMNGLPYRELAGFVKDTTGTFTLDFNDSIVSAIANFTSTIEYFDLSSFPPSSQMLEVFPPYNVYDSANGMSDTVYLTPDYTSDSTWFYIVDSELNDYYTNRSTYLNNTFGLNPPSIGVVTFDGMNEFGLPYSSYNPGNPTAVNADELSSVPIDLSNLPDTDVFFSFYFQPKGLSIDRPDPQDSLILEFFNVDLNKWQKMWAVSGYDSLALIDDYFLFENIRVPDSLQKKGFRFRFRNYASSTGGFDQWHLDYLYLNNGRSINDTSFLDIAYVYDAPSLLKDFTAMPWFHFQTNPASYMIDTAKTLVVNSSSLSLTVYDKMLIRDTVPDTVYYRFPATDIFVFLPPNKQFTYRYPVDFAYSTNDVSGPGVFEATYDIDFRPSMSQPQDFIRSNDTVIGKTVLKDYYAYDDGTAEAGYGVIPDKGNNTSFVALEYNIPFPDTVGGVQLYFLPQGYDIRGQEFELTIWNSLAPVNVIFSMPMRFNPQYTDDNGFLTYNFDSLVKVNQTFYIGLKSIGERSLNIGYDLNTDSWDKLFHSTDGAIWNLPSPGIRRGSLMMRPVFRKTAFGVGIKEANEKSLLVSVFPNPTNGFLNIVCENEPDLKEIYLLDINGRLMLQQEFSNSINLNQYSPGIYFLQLTSKTGQRITKKIIISP